MPDEELSEQEIMAVIEEVEKEAAEVEAIPEPEIIAGDPDAVPPDYITIGRDGYCRGPDFKGLGYSEEDVLAAIRAGFETVNDALAAAGRNVKTANRIALQALGNMNMAEALATLSNDETNRASADAWMATIEDDGAVAMASMPREQADEDGST